MTDYSYDQFTLEVLLDLRSRYADDAYGVRELDAAIRAKEKEAATEGLEAFARDYAMTKNGHGDYVLPLVLKALCSDGVWRRFYPTKRTAFTDEIKGHVNVKRYAVSGRARYDAKEGLTFMASPSATNGDLLPDG
jgi:hypothetical protein